METYALVIWVLSGVITICTVLGIIWKAFKSIDKLQDRGEKNAEDIKMLQNQIIDSSEEADARRTFDTEMLQEEIRLVKSEAAILVEGVSACLDGLCQLGANHSVTDVKQRLDSHVNAAAHR